MATTIEVSEIVQGVSSRKKTQKAFAFGGLSDAGELRFGPVRAA